MNVINVNKKDNTKLYLQVSDYFNPLLNDSGFTILKAFYHPHFANIYL